LYTAVRGANLLQWAPTAPKPVVVVWPASATDAPGYRDMVAAGVPIFHSFTRCFEALRDFGRYQARGGKVRRRRTAERALTPIQTQVLNVDGVLPLQAALQLVSEAGVRLARECLAPSAAAAGQMASGIGETVVLKISSAAFPHKTEAGLVRVGVAAQDAAAVAADLLARARALEPDAVIEGVQIQEMVCGGIEMIVGLSRDAQCGMCLTLGFGGIYAELLRDVVVRPLPVDDEDIREMVASLRLAPLLDGWRGAPAADKEAFFRLARQVADLGGAAQGRLVELDLNPVMVLPTGAVAVDVLAVARRPAGA
jgi:acyl-CoA synthetase (NDP forming)